jgi:hypothetical protein
MFSLQSIDILGLLNERVYYFITISSSYHDFQMRLSTMYPQSPEFLEEMNKFTKFWQKNQLFYSKLPHSINAIASKIPDAQLLEKTINGIFDFLAGHGQITPSDFVNPGYFLHTLATL